MEVQQISTDDVISFGCIARCSTSIGVTELGCSVGTLNSRIVLLLQDFICYGAGTMTVIACMSLASQSKLCRVAGRDYNTQSIVRYRVQNC
jgi:hypothetical protein